MPTTCCLDLCLPTKARGRCDDVSVHPGKLPEVVPIFPNVDEHIPHFSCLLSSRCTLGDLLPLFFRRDQPFVLAIRRPEIHTQPNFGRLRTIATVAGSDCWSLFGFLIGLSDKKIELATDPYSVRPMIQTSSFLRCHSEPCCRPSASSPSTFRRRFSWTRIRPSSLQSSS